MTDPESTPRIENRKTNNRITVRFDDEQWAELMERCDRSRLPPSTELKRGYFGTEPPRKLRRPTVNAKALYALQVELNRWGNNLNQIAAGINRDNARGVPPGLAGVSRDMSEITDTIRELFPLIRAALGVTGPRDQDDGDEG